MNLRTTTENYRDRIMEKVAGIGGIFFRAENSEALSEWYETHLSFS